MDAVADVFQSMHIVSVIQARLEASAPWGLKHDGNAEQGSGRHYPTRFAHFGMLTDGSCWLTADCVTRFSRAARERLPVSTRSQKVLRVSRCID